MIDNMNISSFGALKDKKIQFGPGLNVVLGNNELGKSTIHEALRTMLYGFSPATLSAHPYGPWDGSKIFLEGEIRGDGYFGISRTLGDRPEGKLLDGNSIKSIANGPITGIGNISRDIYRQLYAITLDDLSAISDKSWDVILDGLIGSYGLEFIKSPTDAIKDIEIKKNEIFRESRRGKYQLKEIDDEISKLGDELRALDRNVTSYHNLNMDLEKVKVDKVKLRKELTHLKGIESTILSLLDEKKTLSIINGFKDSYNIKSMDVRQAFIKLNGIVEDEKFLEDLIGRKGVFEAEIENLERDSERMTEEELWLIRKKPDIIVARNLVSNIAIGLEKASLKNGEANRLQNQIESDELKMFGRELSDLERLEFEKLDVISLDSYAQESSLKASKSSGKGIILGVASLVSIFMAIAGGYFKVDSMFYVGLLSTGLTLGLLYGDISSKKGLKTNFEELSNIVGNIPVPAVYMKSSDYEYFKSLSAMRPIYYQFKLAKDESKIINLELVKSWDRLIAILEDEYLKSVEVFNISVVKGHIDKLHERLDEIRAKEISQSSNRLKLNNLREKLSQMDNEIDELSHGLKGKFSSYAENFKIDFEDIEKLKRDIKKVEEVADLEDELMSSYDIHGKVLKISEIEQSGYEISLDEVEEIKLKCDGIIVDIVALEKEEGILTEKISSVYDLGERENQAGRVKYLKGEKKKLMIRRAVLTTAQDVIEKFDNEFRAKNQPDIIKRASYYFSKITQGRYADIYTDERSRSFFLTTPHGEKSIDDGFSRGTREQLYLSLRLAIIEHLDKENDIKLPLILDDVFVNWDANRLSGIKELTDEIAGQRQVIMFTCHQSQAQIFKDEGKSNIIFL